MKHYLYAVGAILCWASLPVATGSGLQGLSTEELMFFSFLSYLTPPLAVLFVALVHGQKISPQVLLGMAVIIGASVGGRLILSRSEKRSRA